MRQQHRIANGPLSRVRAGRLLPACAATAGLALALVGCAGPGSVPENKAEQPGGWGQATGTVEFWDTNANPDLTAKWKELIADFETSHKNIKINYVGLPNSSYLQKVDNALATGEVPDVLLIGNDVANLIAQNALVSLDEQFDKSGLAKQIDSAMVTNERQNSADKKLYKAPLTALSDVIWYRTDWLQAAGASEPKSYDDFYALTKQFTQQDKNRFGFVFRGGPGAMPPLFAMTYGRSGVGEFYTKDGKATLDDPANVAALKEYAALYGSQSAKADLTNDYPKMVAAFDGGSGWAMHHNLGSYQDHVKALGAENVVGVQPFPNQDGVINATTPAISGLGILAKSERKAAAWEFVKYMSTKANSGWAETVGQVPANLEAQKDPWVANAQPLRAIVETAQNPKTHYLTLPTYLPDWSSICKTEMEPDFQGVLQKKMTVEDFTAKYAKRFETALAEYKAHPGG
jgi:multiple sugar transport system substrate-binding protein